MAEEETEVKRDITPVGRLMIDKREAAGVGKQVLRAEIAVAQAEAHRAAALDERGDEIGDVRQTLLNSDVERLDAKLLEDGAVGELRRRIRGTALVDQPEQPASGFAQLQIDLAGQQH